MKIGLDLADILRISKLDWRDGGEEGKEGRREAEGEESYFVMFKYDSVGMGGQMETIS